MADLQRMLKPLANRIVGNAIHVVGRKKMMSPKFPIARGVKVRGPNTMSGAVGKLSNSEKKAIRIEKSDACETLAKAMELAIIGDSLEKRKRKIAAKVVRAAVKFIGPKKGTARNPWINRMREHAARKITNPKSQFATRLGMAIAGIGSGTLGGVIGHRTGKKKGHREGYVHALEDVMSTAKGVSNNLEKRIEDLQSRGVTLGHLRKQIASMPVVGSALVREDLQPSKKNITKDAIGYVPATSKPIGISGRPSYNQQPKDTRSSTSLTGIKRKVKKPKQQVSPIKNPRVGSVGSTNTGQFTGFSTGEQGI